MAGRVCATVLGAGILLCAADLRAAEPEATAANVAEGQKNPAELSLAQVLDKWAAAQESIQTLDVGVRRYTYDRTFFVETRSVGRFYFQQPALARYELNAVEIPEGAVSGKKNEQGVPFNLESSGSATRVWTGQRLLIVNESDRTYEEIPTPPEKIKQFEAQPAGFYSELFLIFAQPQRLMPLVVGVDDATLKDDYSFELRQITSEQAMLSAKPLQANGSTRFHEITVLLDAKTWLPKAIKYVDASQNLETVLVFETPKVNEPLAPGDTPLRPDLQGYKKVARKPMPQ